MYRYLTIMFVLVMFTIKANATSGYYINDHFVSMTESNDRLLIFLIDPTDALSIDSLLDKIAADTDFVQVVDTPASCFIVERKPGSTVSKTDAINYYMACSYISHVSFAFDSDPSGTSFYGVSDEILVYPNPGVDSDSIASLAIPYGLSFMRPDEVMDNVYHLYFGKSVNTFITANDLYLTGSFKFSEPNLFMAFPPDGPTYSDRTSTPCDLVLTLTDPAFSAKKQWGLFTDNTANFNYNYMGQYGGTEYADINICNAWNFKRGSVPPGGSPVSITGSGVVVGVVDDGVAVQTPDLVGNTVTGYDLVLPGPAPAPIYPVTGAPDNLSPHGTYCAGVIAAKQNSIGLSGVAPDAKIMPVRAAYYKGTYPTKVWETYSGYLAQGIEKAWQQGADVINCSWSYTPPPTPTVQIITQAIDNATSNGRGGLGTIVVFSAGNENHSSINWPASYPKVIGVGAMNMCNERKRSSSNPAEVDTNPPVTPDPNGVGCDLQKNWGSNYGKGAYFGVTPIPGDPLHVVEAQSGYMSVAAPGVHIYTTGVDYGSLPTYEPDFWGTSAAAPHVAGLAALMLSANPCLTYQEVKDIIEITATRVGSYSYTNVTGITNGTWTDELGHGRINAADAVTLAYDMYKQDKTETGTKYYKSAHHIYAGKYTTTLLPQNPYIINSTARVTFHAPTNNAIHLDQVFEAKYGAVFEAKIAADVCTNTHSHFKMLSKQQRKRTVQHGGTFVDNSISAMAVYPNPAKDNINVSFVLDEEGQLSFTVFNIIGQKVGETITARFNEGQGIQPLYTQNLIPGFYFVTVKTSQGEHKFKFVKE